MFPMFLDNLQFTKLCIDFTYYGVKTLHKKKIAGLLKKNNSYSKFQIFLKYETSLKIYFYFS